MTDQINPEINVQILTEAMAQMAAALALVNGASAVAPQRAVTVADYMPTVRQATGAGATNTYQHYWKLMEEKLGDVLVHDVSASGLDGLVEWAESNAVSTRSNFRGGLSARENCVGAVRRFFEVAMADKLTEPVGSTVSSTASPLLGRAA